MDIGKNLKRAFEKPKLKIKLPWGKKGAEKTHLIQGQEEEDAESIDSRISSLPPVDNTEAERLTRAKDYQRAEETQGDKWEALGKENTGMERERITQKNSAEPEITPEEKTAVEKEIENLKLTPEDQEKLGLGLSVIGFRAEKAKNDFFAGVFNKALNGVEIKGKKIPRVVNPGSSLGRFCKELRDSFVRDAEAARKKGVAVQKGEDKSKLTRGRNIGLLVGNVARYGRIVTDLTGASLASPLRYIMMVGMITARSAEAGKETRLGNEEVVEKTRIRDADAAAEEAWAIYNAAQERSATKDSFGNVSAGELKEEYLVSIPRDLMKRLENPAAGKGFIQKVASNEILSGLTVMASLGGLKEGDDLLSKEVVEKERNLIKRFEKSLMDYDRMVSQYGVVDELALAGRYAQTAGRAIVGVLTVETLVLSAEKIFEKLYEIHWSALADKIGLDHVGGATSSAWKGIKSATAHLFERDGTRGEISKQPGINETFQGAGKGHDVNLPKDAHLPEKHPFESGLVDEKGNFKSPWEMKSDKFAHQSMIDEKGHFKSPWEIKPGNTPEQTLVAPGGIGAHVETPISAPGAALPDAVVHQGQGVEHAFIRQIEHDPKHFGFDGNINDPKAVHAFAQHEAHAIATKTGYVDNAGHEIRVMQADKVAYEIKIENGHPSVIEKTIDGKILGTYHEGDEFGENPNNQYEKVVDTTHYGVPKAPSETGAGKPSDSFTKLYEGKHHWGIFEQHEQPHSPEGLGVSPVDASHGAPGEQISAGEIPTEDAIRENLGAAYTTGPEVADHMRGGTNINWGPVNQPPYIGGRGMGQSGINTVWHSSGGRQGWGNNSRAEIIANQYGTGVRYNVPGQGVSMGYFPGLSENDNLILHSHPEFMKNPFHLDGQSLMEVYQVNSNNLRHIFQPDVLERWNTLKLLKAKDFLADKNFATDKDWGLMFRHLGRLQEISGLKPKGGGLFRRAESLEQYIVRASQRILAKGGSLENITLHQR